MRKLSIGTVAILVVMLLAACGGRTPPHNTIVVSCPGNNHSLGQCLPKPLREKVVNASSGGIYGPDFSNNDPVYGTGAWRAIAARNKFVYLKSVEGSSFYDSTAGPMASAAKSVGLPVGGYDFIHLCEGSAYSQASFFVRALRAQGLLASLPPAGDVEFGSTGCGFASWMNQWISTVKAQTHVTPIIYTGAWFWQTSYWPQGVLSWISGYGVGYPSLPSGLNHLDIWQYSDHGYNGVSSADESIWMHSTSAFAAFAHSAKPAPPREHCFGKRHSSSKHCAATRKRVAKDSRDIVHIRKRLTQLRCWTVNRTKSYCRGFFHAGDAAHTDIRRNLY